MARRYSNAAGLKTIKRRMRKEYVRSLQDGTGPDSPAALPAFPTGPLTIHDGTGTNTPSIILIPPPNTSSSSSQEASQEPEDEVFDGINLSPPPLGSLGRLDTNVGPTEYRWIPFYLIEKDRVERKARLKKRQADRDRDMAEMNKRVKDHETMMKEGLFEGEKKSWAKEQKKYLRSLRESFKEKEKKRKDKAKEKMRKQQEKV